MDYVFWGSMVVVASSNLLGTFDHLSRDMTMHDKANFTIAPIIYLFIIDNKLFKLKI
jgi:hypothetical protein